MSPWVVTMMKVRIDNQILTKGGGAVTTKSCINLARCRGDVTGTTSPSSGNCYKIGTWNVRSLFETGKLWCVIMEMERMELQLSETFWTRAGEFRSCIPSSNTIHCNFYSGGDKNRRGVAFIVREDVARSIMYYQTISERNMCMKILGKPRNVLIFKVWWWWRRLSGEDGGTTD